MTTTRPKWQWHQHWYFQEGKQQCNCHSFQNSHQVRMTLLIVLLWLQEVLAIRAVWEWCCSYHLGFLPTCCCRGQCRGERRGQWWWRFVYLSWQCCCISYQIVLVVVNMEAEKELGDDNEDVFLELMLLLHFLPTFIVANDVGWRKRWATMMICHSFKSSQSSQNKSLFFLCCFYNYEKCWQ